MKIWGRITLAAVVAVVVVGVVLYHQHQVGAGNGNGSGGVAQNCVGSWGDWSDCNCSDSKQTRTYSVVTPAANGGTACPSTPASRNCTPSGCDVSGASGPASGASTCRPSNCAAVLNPHDPDMETRCNNMDGYNKVFNGFFSLSDINQPQHTSAGNPPPQPTISSWDDPPLKVNIDTFTNDCATICSENSFCKGFTMANVNWGGPGGSGHAGHEISADDPYEVGCYMTTTSWEDVPRVNKTDNETNMISFVRCPE